MTGIKLQSVWVKDTSSDDNPNIFILKDSKKVVVLSRNTEGNGCRDCWFLHKGHCTNAIIVCTGTYTEDPSAVLEDL